MVRKPVRILPEAELELQDIYDYVARHSYVAYADQILNRIMHSLKGIEIFPQSGKRRDDLLSGLRQIVVGLYLVFYQEHEAEILVVHILHGARDLEQFFS
jgi:toxin ParE1/3/4